MGMVPPRIIQPTNRESINPLIEFHQQKMEALNRHPPAEGYLPGTRTTYAEARAQIEQNETEQWATTLRQDLRLIPPSNFVLGGIPEAAENLHRAFVPRETTYYQSNDLITDEGMVLKLPEMDMETL